MLPVIVTAGGSAVITAAIAFAADTTRLEPGCGRLTEFNVP